MLGRKPIALDRAFFADMVLSLALFYAVALILAPCVIGSIARFGGTPGPSYALAESLFVTSREMFFVPELISTTICVVVDSSIPLRPSLRWTLKNHLPIITVVAIYILSLPLVTE